MTTHTRIMQPQNPTLLLNRLPKLYPVKYLTVFLSTYIVHKTFLAFGQLVRQISLEKYLLNFIQKFSLEGPNQFWAFTP